MRLAADKRLTPPSELGVSGLTDAQESALLAALKVQPTKRTQSVGELREALYGDGSRSNRPTKGGDLTMTIEVTADEAFVGAQRKVTYTVPSTGEKQSLTVKVPAGAVDGGKLRYRGRGEYGANGGARGDLVITTKVEEHPIFKRDGADVRMEFPVSMYEAALGATVEVPAPGGKTCRLKIPAGTQDGKTFRFRDLGAPNVKRKGSKGALYVKVRVKVPTGGNSPIKGGDLSEAPTEEPFAAAQREMSHMVPSTDGKQLLSVKASTGESDHVLATAETEVAVKKKVAGAAFIAAGEAHTVALRPDGTVMATGANNFGQCDVGGWCDIVAVAAGGAHTVGLRSDGTVVATGVNKYGQCDISGWRNVIAVAAGSNDTVALFSDGTVLSTGFSGDGWRDFATVSSSNFHSVFLRPDGTVMASGLDDDFQCGVEDWRDVVAVAVGGFHTVGLCSDGTVVATGEMLYGQCNVEGWSDVTAIAAGKGHTVGLRSDGTVVATGNNGFGQCHVDGWGDVVAIAAGGYHTIGLRSDGTFLATGANDFGQCDVGGWLLEASRTG